MYLWAECEDLIDVKIEQKTFKNGVIVKVASVIVPRTLGHTLVVLSRFVTLEFTAK